MPLTPQRHKTLLLSGIALTVILLCGVLLWATKNPLWKLFFESSLDRAKAQQVFHQVQRGVLVPDAAGQVLLPAGDSTLTRDGRIYVTRRGKLLMVLFPTWRGKGNNVLGYLWCNRPLTAGDLKQDEYGHSPAIEIWGPGPWDAMIKPRQTLVVLETPLSEMPYYVSHQLD